MSFLHKNCTGVIYPLTKVGEKANYDTPGDTIEWTLKAYSLEDTTFETSWDIWSLFKLTIKDYTWSVSDSDRIVIDSVKYTVKDSKRYSWITFDSIKILLSSK